MPIKGVHELEVLRFVWQVMNDEFFYHIPFKLREYSQTLRDRLQIGSPKVRTSFGSRQISYSGSQYLNRLLFDGKAMRVTIYVFTC